MAPPPGPQSDLTPLGRIINFSTSIIGAYLPTYGVYVATKAAVEAMTHVLAKELGSRGVTVNAVAPRTSRHGAVPERPLP